MRKLTKSILIGLCALIGFSVGGTATGILSAQKDVQTVSAATTYETKDVAMLGRVAGWYGNGNGTLRITLGECDWASESGQKSFDTSLGLGDLPGLLKSLDFFNHIQLGDKTLAEWGCTSCYDNIYWLNSGEPKYTLELPIKMSADDMAAATAAGIGSNSPITIKEGALIPSYGYLTGTSTLLYRAGCDFVTQSSDVAYGVLAYGKTEVESLQYTTGWDSTYNNAYLGVSLKGDDYAGNGVQTERHPDYYSDVYTLNHYSNKITVDGEVGKAESYGLFNHGEKGKGYYSFVWRAMAEESEAITIPAGTLFPSFAMRTLFDAYGNPVYIMYETQTDVTFYKQADGSWQKPMVEKQTDVASAFVTGSSADNFTVLSLTTHDYPDSADNYGGDVMGTKAFLENSNFYTHVLIDGVALGSTNEAYLNIWGNKGAIGFRTGNGTLTTEITILAGCEIPSYAILSTGERIQYVTTKDITFVKNSEGNWVEKSAAFGDYVAAAKAEIEGYNAQEGLYREAEATQRAQIVAEALAALDNATTEDGVDVIVSTAKADINMLKTAAWYEAQEREQELEALRADALEELKAYKASEIYFPEQTEERNNAIVHAQGELVADESEEEIAATVENVKTMIDNVLTKAQVIENAKAELDSYKSAEGLFLDEQAAERAELVAQAKVLIDNAATQTDVNAVVADAKEEIDKLPLAVEIYTTQDTAMLGRVAGWYGNGNFEIRITLGSADWTNENAGQKTYNGELAQLLNKLDFFNHIKLGDKTLAEWGCTACYDNIYWLNESEPDYTLMIPLVMSSESMAEATAAGIGQNTPITILEGALIPSNGYLTQTGNIVYRAGCDYVTIASGKAYGIEATAKTEVESVKYVQGHDGNNGYFGVSLVGDDYYGDGSQLTINSNYSYDRVFTGTVLVNGEAGQVGYYGLFNLGANGVGYYAFKINVPEEEIVSITIPAGTRFPTRAMTTLFDVNGNPVYIMYEVETEITLYRTAEGYVTYDKVAKAEIESYKAGMFREAEEAERLSIVQEVLAALADAADKEAMDAIVAAAKADIDTLKTAAQYADEENAALAAAKESASNELDAYKANETYFEEQSAERATIIEDAKNAIKDVTSVDSINEIVAQAKVSVDGLATKAAIVEAAKVELDGYKSAEGYFKEEQAAERAAIVADAKTTIDNAATQAAVNSAVASAKAAIDRLMSAAEFYTTEDVAMLARLGGWYGNGNFTLKITLGYADWTNEIAGEKSYDGDLSVLLNKLGFFDYIMVGGKTLAEWGCTACYDNNYELNTGEPDSIFLFHLSMGEENMAAATAAGICADMPVTILAGALVPSYGYLTGTSSVVYSAGCDYVSTNSTVPYGIESVAKTTVESVKYVQGHDGTCGYFGVSLVGDDYLGDGTQLEINSNYDYTNKYSNVILVNGEADKVHGYGLFNLGANGVGYFAFQIDVPEEEVEYITIPAGTRFPTRAMTTLREVNGNPVYIMYEVEETVVLYRTAEGYVSYDKAAIAEIESYKAGMFRAEEEAERLAIVAEAKAALATAADKEAMQAIVAAAKAEIDTLKTAGQYADEENAALAEAKNQAIAELESYKVDGYFEEQSEQRAEIINAAREAMAGVLDEDGIAAVIDNAMAEIDALVTKAEIVEAAKAELDGYKAEEGYFKEEQAAERAAIVAQAKTTIDNAATQADVTAAVANAKAAIDRLMSAAEYYTVEDVVMLARLGGWYGNGNFTLKITLGYADWTNEIAGEKSYDGDLSVLLNKLGFFDYIMVGGKTLAEWGCTACYDNNYELNTGEPDSIFLFHLSMGEENMAAATAAGICADMPVTILAGALVPSYGYLTGTSSVVYGASLDYVSSTSTKAYGIESVAKTEVEGVKYVQGHDGTCGYLGISLVGDDYLGDGSQLEINTNYNFENSFVDLILVNGEAGKVAYYGLFNLGENGVGYYAFQIFVPEEEIESITIPAGTRFPTRAMTTLFGVNGNPVYIMYEVSEEITLYRTENGFEGYIVAAKKEVETYKAGMFRAEEEAERLAIVAEAFAALENAADKAEMQAIVAAAKAQIDTLKTAGQYADEENASLATAKDEAIAEIEAYKADEVYFNSESALRAEIIDTAVEAIRNCTEEADIAAFVRDAKAAINELVTKTEIVDSAKAEIEAYKADVTPEEKEEERLTVVANAKDAIENATSQEEVSELLAAAKKEVDRLLTFVDEYTEMDVAFAARIGGWYGNGNFTLKITVGNADWTNAEAGEKTYSGDLTLLLNELDFFNKVMIGGKTLAEWGCTACYDNNYELNVGEPDNIFLFHLTMSQESMDAATAAGIKADAPATILAGALIPSYGYLVEGNPLVYRAGCDYVTAESTKAYGIESVAKTTVESVKYVQGHDGTCGYFGISFVGDDYLGDGTELEINQNYYFDYTFSNLILVNGEVGLVGYYGLFNLGENGMGYYAFQIFVPEEEIESIIIPAGTRFPTRAMTTLYDVNDNPVYIMYEVSEEIALYRTENGFGTYADFAAAELAEYKAGKFRAEEEAERLAIVAEAKAELVGLTDEAVINAIVADAKAAIDLLKTAAQYADEELGGDKKAAIDTMVGYKADVAYLSEQAAAREEIVNAGKARVAEATTLEELAQIVEEAQAAIDALVTKADFVAAAKAAVEGYKADLVYLDAQAAEKAAIVEAAKKAIDGATSQVAIEETVANAQTAIDAIKTKAEVEAEALQAKKDEANAKVDSLKRAIDFDLYDENGITTINGLYASVKAAIENATTAEQIDTAVAEFESALKQVAQKPEGSTSSDNEASDTSNTSDSDSSSEITSMIGCFSIVSGIPCGIVMLVLAGVVYAKRRKEN